MANRRKSTLLQAKAHALLILLVLLCASWVVAEDTAPAKPAAITYPRRDLTGYFHVNWSASLGATAYVLEYSANGGARWWKTYEGPETTVLQSVGTTGSFLYRVAAKNGFGTSDWCLGSHYAGLGGWADVQRVHASDAEQDRRFGEKVAISGNVAVVGRSGGDLYEAVYVFEQENGVWSQTARLDAGPSITEPIGYGVALAVSGDTVVVGATGDAVSHLGLVDVYTLQSGAWTLQQRLIPTDLASGDNYGISVSISGDTIAVGADGSDDNGSWTGSVYVYTRTGGSWEQTKKLQAPSPQADDHFGHCVASTPEIIAVTGYKEDPSGSVYIHRNTGTDWALEAQLPVSGFEHPHALAASGEYVVVSALGDLVGNTHGGQFHVYKNSGSGWELDGSVIQDVAFSSRFGDSLSMSGGIVLIGAPAEYSLPAGNFAGAAHTYRQIDGVWLWDQKLIPGDPEVGEYLGCAVAIDGDNALVGARLNDARGADAGRACLFTHVDRDLSFAPMSAWLAD